jgi:hypothetical protein
MNFLTKNKFIIPAVGLIAVISFINTRAILKVSQNGFENQMASTLSMSSKDDASEEVLVDVKDLKIDNKTQSLIITPSMLKSTQGSLIVSEAGYYDIKVCGAGGGGGGGGIGHQYAGPDGNDNYPGWGGGGGGGGDQGMCRILNKTLLNANDNISWVVGQGGAGGVGKKFIKIWGGNVQTQQYDINSTIGMPGEPSMFILNNTLLAVAGGGNGGMNGQDANVSSQGNWSPGFGGFGGAINNQNNLWHRGKNGNNMMSADGCGSCGGNGGYGINPYNDSLSAGNTINYSMGGERGWWTSGTSQASTGYWPSPSGNFNISANVGLTAYGKKGYDATSNNGGGGGGGGYGMYRIRTYMNKNFYGWSISLNRYIGEKIAGDGGKGGDGYIEISYHLSSTPVSQGSVSPSRN